MNRKAFLSYLAMAPALYSMRSKIGILKYTGDKTETLMDGWNNPPREFSQAPFWFWNDDLSEVEITRQIENFYAHGVFAFIIHPRVGLPKSIGFMSEKYLSFVGYAIREAEKRNMWCLLYDDGMYPSGSASGLVVAENLSYRPHGLFAIDLDEVNPDSRKQGFIIDAAGSIKLEPDQKLVTIIKRRLNGHRIAILDRFISPDHSLIRGIHYLESDPKRSSGHVDVPEEMPLAADILNPDSVKCFIKMVYQRYYDEFSGHFGKTVKGIFTDEPSYFGKNPEGGAVPGNAALLPFVNEWLQKDFSEDLPALWYDDEPRAASKRKEYYRALNAQLDETYYKQLFDWCKEHNTSLTGHPAEPDDIGHLRYFQIPGQDIVWRNVEMDNPNALEGPESTNAKCASSAMVHLKLRRNSNEYCGAYGHDLTFEEMQWLAWWLIIRGCNLLYPHAFYYSIRGPRVDERPPDVGPNSAWWNEYASFTHFVSQACWLNTDSTCVCDIAILGLSDYLPWDAAKVCFENQYEFNYLEASLLAKEAVIDSDGIHIAGLTYRLLIAEFEPPAEITDKIAVLEKQNRIIKWRKSDEKSDEYLRQKISEKVDKAVKLTPKCKDIRVRHIIKGGCHFFMLFNEGNSAFSTILEFGIKGELLLLGKDRSITTLKQGSKFHFQPHTLYAVSAKE